jgi:glucose-6-phosphate-specific signal transduction histidine kinase
MNDAMLGLIEEMELRIQHLRTLAELQANVREQNATLMREVARLRAENRALNNIIDQAGVRNRVNLYA